MKNIGKVLAPFGGLAFVGGCINASSNSGTNPDDPSGINGMNQALTADDLNHMGPIQKVAFTEPGDNEPNIGTLNGKVVVTFNNGYGRENNYTNCYYVMADDILAALSQPQTVKKVDLPYPYDGMGCPIYDNRIIFGGAGMTWAADLRDNDGELTTQNPQQLPRQQVDGGVARYYDDGTDRTIAPQNDTLNQLLLSRFTVNGRQRLMTRNLNTNQMTLYYDDDSDCGSYNRAAGGGEWVGGVWDANRDAFNPIRCYIARDPSFEISGQNRVTLPGSEADSDGGVEAYCEPGHCGVDLRNPRLYQDVLIVEGRREQIPPPEEFVRILDSFRPELYFSRVQPYPEDAGMPSPDAGQATDGGNGPDGGQRADGGSSLHDGGSTARDGGSESDAGIQPADGGAQGPDGGAELDAGIQQNDGGTGINTTAGCCNVLSGNPSSNMASTILLAISIVGMKLRNALRKKKNK